MEPTTSDLSDSSNGRLRVCELQFRQFGGVDAMVGRIRTVLCADDSVLVKRVIEEDGHGQVLVVDGGASMRCALFGEKSAHAALANGWAGVIVHGAVRDVGALASIPLSVKALGSSPRRAHQHGTGAVDVPVVFGGVSMAPGEQLWSDLDGVVVGSLEHGEVP